MNYLLNWLEKNKEKKIRPSASPTFYRNFLESSGEVRSDKHYTSTVTSLCRDLTTRGKRDVSRRVDLPQTLRRIRDGRECVLPSTGVWSTTSQTVFVGYGLDIVSCHGTRRGVSGPSGGGRRKEGWPDGRVDVKDTRYLDFAVLVVKSCRGNFGRGDKNRCTE